MFLRAFLQISILGFCHLFFRRLCLCSVPAFLSLHALPHTVISHLILLSLCSYGAHIYVWGIYIFFLYFPVMVRGITYLTLGNPTWVEKAWLSGRVTKVFICLLGTKSVSVTRLHFCSNSRALPTAKVVCCPQHMKKELWNHQNPFHFSIINTMPVTLIS